MGLLTKYSGITAIFVYLFLLWAYVKLVKKKKASETVKEVKTGENTSKEIPLDMNDEDAVVASLVAAIECRNEYHKNVKVVSVRNVA